MRLPGYPFPLSRWRAAALIVFYLGGQSMSSSAAPIAWLDGTVQPAPGAELPFSFQYDGRPSGQVLAGWPARRATRRLDPSRSRTTVTWTDPASRLRVVWEVTRFEGFPAADWVLRFENAGTADTPIIADVQALDAAVEAPLPGNVPYVLHRTNGAPADPSDFEPSTAAIRAGGSETLGGGGGRSSNRDFPFFRIDAADGTRIVAVGWSGQWAARLACDNAGRLDMTAGLEQTHFRLHPSESVRTPRILVLHWRGDPLEAGAQFRRLIFTHYAAKRAGETPLPTLFCNTCFTRGGGWLNECNAANQISLIRAFAPLGVEALITDAGWFEGGWPDGAGNWTPRRDAYPEGFAPVASAARANGMVYGLWFEPERVVKGTGLYRSHPDWILTDGSPDQQTFLADFGRKEVQEYFFRIVRGFMALPGFRFYRQDFNMDPLPCWRHTDAPDRQGITEMKYIAGLYAYWDRIATAFPDSIREECASGGRRIDLETVQRMHLHQASDYWFDDDVVQARAWGLSQYLPNGLITEPVNRLDDYSVYSAIASSLIPGWIADAPGFDMATARRQVDTWRFIRPYLAGAWYPLLPYSRSADAWMASQYHRPDLDAGCVLAFRHAASPDASVTVSLHGLHPDVTYELTTRNTGAVVRANGASLMNGVPLAIPGQRGSTLITYRALPG